MRKTQSVYETAFTRGLRPDKRVQKTEEYLAKCYGFRPMEYGLVGERVLSNPITGTFDPEAQVINGKTVYFLDWVSITASIKPVNTSAWTLGADILTSGQAKSAADNSTMLSLVSDGLPFNSLFMSDARFIWNSSCFLTNVFGTWMIGTKTASIVPNAATLFQGRLVVGGMNTSSALYSADLWAYALGISRRLSDDHAFSSSDSMSNEFILIGSKAGGSVGTPYLPVVCMLGGYKSTTIGGDIQDFFRDREMRLVKPPWGGEVLSLMEIGDSLLIGTSKGVGLMRIGEGGFVAFRQIHNHGVCSRSSFVQVYEKIYFVDNQGHLFEVAENGSYTLRGFSEYLRGLDLSNTWSIRNSEDRCVAYTDGTNCYSFGEGVGFKSRYCPFSVLEGYGGFYGTAFSTGIAMKSFETHQTDFKQNGIKRVGYVGIGQNDCNAVYAQGLYNHTRGDALVLGSSIRLNKEDLSYLGITGVDLAFAVSCTGDEDSTINRLDIVWESVDKRYIRNLQEGMFPNANNQ